jgi:hypothetical protein
MIVTKHLLACAAVFGLMTNVALAQDMTGSDTLIVPPAPAPAGNVSVTKTQRTIDANGIEHDSAQTYEKTESGSSGNGMLSTDTHVQTSRQTTTIVPPPHLTTTTTRTTTTERTE